ncbi:hypothetical protein ANCCAN_11893 [Ancylostoma caninum]|uniref:Uncharacterized protein n=1 Tax=Ancylostoma caninum TaxID=29170 RepID=A0A368GCQ4_ANCCA|nr:hypothetical protein ANCCAN_11893 [Ancylostoma caninum]
MATPQKMAAAKGDTTVATAAPAEKMEVEEALDEEILRIAPEDPKSRTHLLNNEIHIMGSEVQRISHSVSILKESIKENNERIKVNKTLSYLVPNVMEILGFQDIQEEDSYLILEKLTAGYDSRVKVVEVDERSSELCSNIGGCDKQIQELIEDVVLPMTHKDRFVNLASIRLKDC